MSTSSSLSHGINGNTDALRTDDYRAQQDDLDSLQITFYEIEAWVEKATPVLARMTNALEKASHQFQKRRKSLPTQLLTTLGDNSMLWTLSFQPGNSLRLETNINSFEQLVEAVRRIRALVGEPSSSSTRVDLAEEEAVPLPLSRSDSYVEMWIDPLETDPSTEYWHVAIRRRPQTCLENYRHCEMDLSRLTEDVLPNVLNYIGQVYWDCLHPKFTCDWYSFWDRSGDPRRNQVCIDSGLAIVFLHVIRHDRNACNNARDIAYYYYDRARESLMEFFDSPDCATLETLLNLAMFCMICKRHSQARIYISLAFRMMLEMGMHRWPQLPMDRVLRKKYMKLFMVLYYNDLTTSLYSGDPFIILDEHCDVDFYEVIKLNKILYELGEGGCNENMVVKETYFAHLLELARIGKRTRHLMRDYEGYLKRRRDDMNELPVDWAKRIHAIELALARWFDRLPDQYRLPRERHPMPPEMLREQSGPLLMLQYQMQWILLHKAFVTGKTDAHATNAVTPPTSPHSLYHPQQRSDRSRLICIDAANRIVVLAELISGKYGWCVCQQFIHCIYQASTIFCRVALSKDSVARHHAKYMIYRIIRILRSSHNFQGLPNDLTACLHEFLADHGMQISCHEPLEDEENTHLIDQFFLCVKSSPHCGAVVAFSDTAPNSPHTYKQVLAQTKSLVL
ncbi:hypothetical protein BX666DRAFT_1866291 [Dichotomocladium elegans]|nr:hypothetical protein BX666DRAFT_1866291 [Dichotomocladium elegans]